MDIYEFAEHYQVALQFQAETDPKIQESFKRHKRLVQLKKRPASGNITLDDWVQEEIKKLESYVDCQTYFKAHTSDYCIRNAKQMIKNMSGEDQATLILMGLLT